MVVVQRQLPLEDGKRNREAAGRIILAAGQMFAPGEDLMLHFRGEGRGGIYRVEASRPGRRQEDAAQHVFITYALRQA